MNQEEQRSWLLPVAGLMKVLRFQWPGLILAWALLAIQTPAFGEPLTVVLMPMENEATAVERPFAPPGDKYPHLRFDNPASEWQELCVGYHGWLCSELEQFGARTGETIHVRFLAWKNALDDLTVTYKGKYDVLQVPSTWTARLIRDGILDKSVDFDPGNYPPALLETCRMVGQKEYYAVPWHMDLRVLYYRPELTRNPEDLATFASLCECLARDRDRMRGEESSRFLAPLGMEQGRTWDVLHNTLNWVAGGRVIAPQNGNWRAVCAEGEARDGVYKLYEAAQRGLVHFGTRETSGPEADNLWMIGSLIDGRYHAVVGGPCFRIPLNKRHEVDIQAVPLPQMVPDNPHTFLGGCHIGLSTAVRNRGKERQARELVKYLTGPEVVRGIGKRTVSLPADQRAFREFLEENPRWKVFGEALKHAEAYPSIPEWAKVEDDVVLGLLQRVVESIALKQKWDVVEVQLGAAAAKIDEIIQPIEGVGVWEKLVRALQQMQPFLLLSLLLLTLVLMWRLFPKPTPLMIRAVQEELKGVTDEILAAAGVLSDETRRALSAPDKTLAELHEEVRALNRSALKSEDDRKQFEEAFGQLNQVQTGIELIQEQFPAHAQHLDEVVAKVDAIRERVDKVLERLDTSGLPPLKECTLVAIMGHGCYGSKKPVVTLSLVLFHPGGKRILGGKMHWRGKKAYLFELAVNRYHLGQEQEIPEEETGISLSDYVLIGQNVPGITEAEGLVQETACNTAAKLLKDFRAEVYRFAKLRCSMKTDDGQEIKQDRFLFAARRTPPHQKKPRRIGDRQPESHGYEAHSAGSHYEFVLPSQVNSFWCNIMWASDRVQQLEEMAQLPDGALYRLVRLFPRCKRAWKLLVEESGAGSLSSKDKEMIAKGIGMLAEEASWHKDAAAFWRGAVKKYSLHEAFGESGEEVERRFSQHGAFLDILVSKLRLKLGSPQQL